MLRRPQRLSKQGPTGPESGSGLYLLIIKVTSPLTTTVGAIGTHDFLPGYYAYCGSARRNLSGRLSRHRAREKRLHWHIDYLTCREEVSVERADTFPCSGITECELNSLVQGLPHTTPIRDFGCSDCTCSSHLTYIGERSADLRFDLDIIHGSS
jgi:sugar fermentation stimulation protein A